MNATEVPAGMIDCRLVLTTSEGERVFCGEFLKRGTALSTAAFLIEQCPGAPYSVEPVHPEIPALLNQGVTKHHAH